MQEGQADSDGQQRSKRRRPEWGPPRADVDAATWFLAGVAFAGRADRAAAHVRALADPRPLHPGAARPGPGDRPRPPVHARFRSLRAVDRLVRGVSRNRRISCTQPVLHAAARRREVPVLRPRPHRVVLQNWLWTGHLQWYDQALSAALHDPLHRASHPGLLPVAEAAGAVLPVRRDAAGAQLHRRADVRPVPGGAALGGGPGGPDPRAGQPGRRAAGHPRRCRPTRARSTTWSTATATPRSRRCTAATRS